MTICLNYFIVYICRLTIVYFQLFYNRLWLWAYSSILLFCLQVNLMLWLLLLIGVGYFLHLATSWLVSGGVPSKGWLQVPMKQPARHHRLSVKSRSSQKSDSVDTLTTVTSRSQHTGDYVYYFTILLLLIIFITFY